MKTKIIVLLLTFICLNIYAQNPVRFSENQAPMNVIELDTFLASINDLQRSSSPTAVSLLNIENLRKLVYTSQPSIYYYSGIEKIYGEKPRNLFTDLNSLNNLNSGITLKNNIEIITIKLENPNQLNSTINLELFSNFKNLKYIYIVTGFETDVAAISNIIVGSNMKYSIFYNVEIGDTN